MLILFVLFSNLKMWIQKYLYFFTQIKTIKNSEEYINNAVLEENNEMNLNNKQKL